MVVDNNPLIFEALVHMDLECWIGGFRKLQTLLDITPHSPTMTLESTSEEAYQQL